MRAVEEARAVAAVRGLVAALDVLDFEAARRRLAAEVDLDYVSLWGGEPLRLPADEIVHGWRATLIGFDAVRHDLGLVRIAVGGSHGQLGCEAEVSHHLDGDVWRLSGLYRFGLVRQGAWRIAAIAFERSEETGDRRLLETARRRSSLPGLHGRA